MLERRRAHEQIGRAIGKSGGTEVDGHCRATAGATASATGTASGWRVVAVPPVPLAMFGVAVTGMVPWARPWTEVAVATVVAVPT